MSLNFHSFWGPPVDPLADTFFLCLTKESLNVLHFALQVSAEKKEQSQITTVVMHFVNLSSLFTDTWLLGTL